MVFSFLHSLLQKQVYSQSPYKKVDNSEVTKKKKKKESYNCVDGMRVAGEMVLFQGSYFFLSHYSQLMDAQ